MSLRPLWAALTGAMSSWHQGKLFLEHTIGIDHDALHIIVGAVAWLVFALVLRRRLTSVVPWACILVLILWNEASDLWIERWPDPGMQYGEGAKDILLTMFVPTFFALAIHLAPRLFLATSPPG